MNESIEQKITAVIESVPKPEFVASVSFRLAEDWSGDPAVMILVLLKDHAKPDKAYWDTVNIYDFRLLDTLSHTGLGYFFYTSYRMESEQAELDTEEREDKAKRERRGHRKTALAV